MPASRQRLPPKMVVAVDTGIPIHHQVMIVIATVIIITIQSILGEEGMEMSFHHRMGCRYVHPPNKDHHLRGMLEAVLNGYLWVLVAVCSRA